MEHSSCSTIKRTKHRLLETIIRTIIASTPEASLVGVVVLLFICCCCFVVVVFFFFFVFFLLLLFFCCCCIASPFSFVSDKRDIHKVKQVK